MTPLEMAQDFVARGWRVIPVQHREKKPFIKEWQKLTLESVDLPRYFNGEPSNVGVLLGDPSGGLIDCDIDVDEALALADLVLPSTGSMFGRASRALSHRIYVGTPLVPTEKFQDPEVPETDKTAMLVELRANGCQTILPGSTHPSGEVIRWDQDETPATIAGPELRRAVAQLAALALLARHWPTQGARHEAALAASGFLVRTGLDDTLVVRAVGAIAQLVGDTEWRDRQRAARDTVVAYRAGEATTGAPRLADVLRGNGEKLVTLLWRWLGGSDEATAPRCTDTGNAARFVAAHGEACRYVYAWNCWIVWNGSRWQRDVGDAVIRKAKETARAVYAEAARAPDEAQRKLLAKWASYTESEPGIRRMVTLAQAELAVTPSQLDADPWLLNCPNGTLELRTGHLRPHRCEDFLTNMTAAPYDAAARSAVWDSFLESALPDERTRDYAQRFAGYSLTGSTREEVFIFCRGPAGAGKSTFTEGLRRTWGDYATSADFSSFLMKKPNDGPREDIARLARARLVTSVETRDGQQLAEGMVKLLTGGDTVTARRLYEQSFEFVPLFKLLLASNYRPRASADDEGLWRRLRELPFPTARPRREDRDDSVKAMITDPDQAGPAIIAWAVEGCARWLAEGLGEPDAVMQATSAYRKSMEPLTEFVAACCVLGSDYGVPAGRLREEYEGWSRSEGIKHPVGGRGWGAALRALGCTDRRAHGGVRWWDSIDLRIGDVPPVGQREPGEDNPALFGERP